MSFADRFRRYPELRGGIVNLKSGTALRGVIWKMRGPFVVLRNAEILQDRGQQTKQASMDGEVVVRLDDIDFVQVL